MNPADTITKALIAEPRDRAAYCALVDETMEQTGCSADNAHLVVAKIVRQIWDARQMAAAARVLAPRSRFRAIAHRIIRCWLPNTPQTEAFVILIPGYHGPRLGVSVEELPPDPLPAGMLCSVGAEWLLEELRRWQRGYKKRVPAYVLHALKD